MEAVRFYEKQGLIEPAKRTSGNFSRLYGRAFETTFFYLLLPQFGYFTERNQNVAQSSMCTQEQEREINELLDRHIREVSKRIHELAHLRIRLIQLKGKCSQFEQNNDLMNTLLQHSGINFVPLK